MATPTGMQEGFVTLWAGEDPAFRDTLLEELQSAGIAFVDRSIGDTRDTSNTDPFFVGQSPMFGFQVAVHSSNVAAAEKILDRLLDEEPVDMELPAAKSADEDPPAPAAELRQPSGSGATSTAVWSGGDEGQAEFLFQALRENDIPVRLDAAAGTATLFVPQVEETLAREIIREILEGQAPA